MSRWLPRWYRLAWSLWATLLIATAVAYYMGAGGLRTGSVRIAFEPETPQQLLKLDDARALLITQRMISLVRYERSNPLLYVCGCVELAGTIVNDIDRQHGDWLYTSHAGKPRYGADAVNIATGETLTIASDRDAPETQRALAARGFAPASDPALTPASVAAAHDTLWLRKESCMIWLLAYYAIALLLLLLAPLAVVQSRRAARRT